MSNVSMIDGHIDDVTDNEIIKALEVVISQHETVTNKEWSLSLSKETTNSLLNLFNRQKAEIERYKGVIKILENDVATAKSEAVKEFDHLIIDKAENGVIHAMDIPDYVQEMAGESE